MNRYIFFITNKRYKKLLILSIIIITLLAIVTISQKLFFDANWRIWYTQDTLAKYDSFVDRFGYDDELLIDVESKLSWLDYNNLKKLKEMTSQLEKLSNVESVESIANIPMLDANSTSVGYYRLDKLPKSRYRDILKSNGLMGYLLSNDSRNALIVVHFDSSLSTAPIEKSYQLFDDIKNYLAPFKKVYKFHFFGSTPLNRAFEDIASHDISTLFPLVVIVITVLLYILFQGWGIVFIYWGMAIIATLWVLAIEALSGHGLNNFTINLPLFIMIISLTDFIHLCISYHYIDKYNQIDRLKKIYRVIKINIVPMLLTSLTTAVGFLSFYNSEIEPIRRLGISVALAILIVFVLTIFFFVTYTNQKRGTIGLHHWVEDIVEAIIKLIKNHYRKILFGMTLVATILMFGTVKLTIGSNLFKYFKDDAPLKQEMSIIESRLTGLVPIDIIFDTKKDNGAVEPHFLENIYEFIHILRKEYPQLRQHPTILDTIVNLYHSVESNATTAFPPKQDAISQLLLLLEMSSTDQKLNRYFDSDKRFLHISLLSNEVGSIKNKKLIEAIKRYNLDGVSVEINGSYPLFIMMQDSVTKTLFYSLGFTFLLLFVLLRMVFSSFRDIAFILSINLLPILSTFGLLGYLGIQLDLGFAISFAIILSIAIDDTMHFMWRYKQYKNIDKTIREVGAGIIISSLVLFVGFILFAFSQFVPNIHFGISVAISLLLALLYDIFWLPAYLYYRGN